MALEEVVEGTPLNIPFPAKHHTLSKPPHLQIRPLLSNSFSSIP